MLRISLDKEPVNFRRKAHGTKSGYLLDPFLVAYELIPRRTLLAEPEYPSAKARRSSQSVRQNLITVIKRYEHTYISGGFPMVVGLQGHSRA